MAAQEITSWTGAHEFRQYWADVNDRGGKHAYEFVKYTAGDFSDEDTWMEIYNYLEPGDIVQYVRTSDWDTYHTQIVHRTSYENGEYKVSMGQHSPFSWANLRNYVNTLSSGTIVYLIKISAPSTRSMDAVNSFNLKSMDALSEQMDDFRSEVLGFGDDADYYALWMYFWDELLGEKAPDRYVT